MLAFVLSTPIKQRLVVSLYVFFNFIFVAFMFFNYHLIKDRAYFAFFTKLFDSYWVVILLFLLIFYMFFVIIVIFFYWKLSESEFGAKNLYTNLVCGSFFISTLILSSTTFFIVSLVEIVCFDFLVWDIIDTKIKDKLKFSDKITIDYKKK